MDDQKNEDDERKTLDELWVLHDHSHNLRVRLGDKDFHVKQKSRLGGYTLSDEKGATYFIKDSARSKCWIKLHYFVSK